MLGINAAERLSLHTVTFPGLKRAASPFRCGTAEESAMQPRRHDNVPEEMSFLHKPIAARRRKDSPRYVCTHREGARRLLREMSVPGMETAAGILTREESKEF